MQKNNRWTWQEEWHGLTIDDIREIERQTQLALQRKMGNADGSVVDEEGMCCFFQLLYPFS
jgi:Phosphatidylinositol transfer protein